METQSTVNERINALSEHFAKGNKTAFAREIGTLPSVLASIIGGRMSKPSFELLEKIATRYPEVSGSWLLTGRGPMIVPIAPGRVKLPYKPPTRSTVSWLPDGATDHLEEFYMQQGVDFQYLIAAGDYLAAIVPSELMQDFRARLPYTLNPDYDPDQVEPTHDASGNPIV